MMRDRIWIYRCCLAVILLLTTITGWGQQTMVTGQITTSNGLSDNSVLCALRDSYGFLWIGTENGLNCFDGQRIRVYRDMVQEENPNETNTVKCLYEHKDDIWFGGEAGLYVFNRYNNSYSRFSKRTRYGVIISSTVPKIVGHDRFIWIITLGQGVFIYDTEKETLIQDSRHDSFFSDITVGDDGLIYTVTLSGMVDVFRSDGQFLRGYNVLGNEYNKDPINIIHLGEDVWLSYDTQLLRLNQATRMTEQQISYPSLGTIHAITADRKNCLYVGSDNGVYRYIPQTKLLERIDGTGDNNQLSDIMVNGLMWDADSTLLALTGTGGVNCISLQQQGFAFAPLPVGAQQTERNIVHALCRGPKGELWMGTDHGLYRGNYSKQFIEKETRLPAYEINALMSDGNDLWIGTRHNGLIVFNIETGQIRRHTYSNTLLYTIPSNEIKSIYRTSRNDIYVLTSWGLSRYDRSTGYFHGYANISAMTSFICMQEDASGWIWASSSNRGLFCKRPQDNSFENYYSKSIGRQTVNAMLSDSQGDLWMATNNGGLYRYDRQASDFVRYDIEGSILRNLVVSFIEEDEQGALWLGTQAGIMRIGPSRDLQGLQVYNFVNTANFFMFHHSSSIYGYDNIVFGGDRGVYVFSTNQMLPNIHQQKVYIQELSLPYTADSRRELQRLGLDILLYTREKIELPFQDNSFTLHFSSARYSGMPEAKYEYMLQGFDHTWIHGTTTHEATYANLPPGNYVFLLRITGQTDEENYAKLKISILPPWYRTTLAYLAYLLLILAAVTGVYYLTQHRLKLRYQQQMDNFRQQQEKETFQSKIQFFIDLVHEIRTPLTLISLPLESMSDELKGKNVGASFKKHLVSIRRNMDYLLGITNQLLDFQKQENGGITLVLNPTDMKVMLRQIYDQFNDAAEVQGKNMQLQLPDDSVVMNIDQDKMIKVLMNLVGNALKYTKSEIILRMTVDENVNISVIDDGHGVPAEEKDKIFDRYYQIGNDSTAATMGTGLGLAYAKMLAEAHQGDIHYEDAPGGGSCFTISLKNEQINVTAQSQTGKALLPKIDSPVAVETEQEEKNVSSYRILLVEDNEELLKATGDALRQWYKIVKARDGIEALEMLKYHDVDMIISDVMMPRMNGVELCRKLKQDLETSHLPVIMLTAKVSVDAKVEGMESGADVYLEKPFSIRQLHAQIENLLRLRQQFYERMRSIDGFKITTNDTNDKPFGLNQQDLQFVESLQRLVEENMHDEEFSIDTLADHLNLSRSSFYRKLKALTGMTPTDYLKSARMNKAAMLLRDGLRSSEVAERVGFTSSSYFAKCFRAQFGCLPKDYLAV